VPLGVWMPGADDDEFLGALRGALGAEIDLRVAEALPAGFAPRVLVRGVPTSAQLAACVHLERVIIPYAGVPERTRSLVSERAGLSLHNLHHNAAPAAELAIALLLAAVKRVVPHDRDLRGGDWRRRYGISETTTLAGRHALILGYGAIGRRVARMCRGLDMSVAAIRRGRDGGTREDAIEIHSVADLHALLPRADALMVCLPLTKETRGLVGAAELALLPEQACLVNVGRGALVDEEALFASLTDGRLDCAGLDVWYRYPHEEAERAATMPSTQPFHELDNVVLSPHRAGLTRQNEALRARDLSVLLRAAAAGRDVGNAVDPARGY